jgi:GDP-L-fucose synthase
MKSKILIAGQEGMVGSAVYKILKNKNYNILNCKRNDLDFTSQKSVEIWFKKNKPEIVINAAGRVGGILDNYNSQDEFLYKNTMIGLNIINSSLKNNVKKLINLGSACIYPKEVDQPISESSLLSSSLEQTNEGYALSKIIALKYCQYLKKKYKKNFISVQPANLYGEGDNFNLKSSHVLPALVKKFYLAKKKNKKFVEVWGSGKVRREFLNVNDLAEAIYFLVKRKINHDYINIGGGEDVSIKQLAYMIKSNIKYTGKIFFNQRYPDGVKKRIVNSLKIRKMGWKPKIKLKDGLKDFCQYYSEKIYPLEKKL